MDLSKENLPQHKPRRIVLVCISFEFGYNSGSFCYSPSFYGFSATPSVMGFFFFMLLSFAPSQPSTCRSDG